MYTKRLRSLCFLLMVMDSSYICLFPFLSAMPSFYMQSEMFCPTFHASYGIHNGCYRNPDSRDKRMCGNTLSVNSKRVSLTHIRHISDHSTFIDGQAVSRSLYNIVPHQPRNRTNCLSERLCKPLFQRQARTDCHSWTT